jgi:uncharacterized membrane protein
MKRLLAGLLVLAMVADTGCTQGTPGGPGASGPDAKKPLYGQADDTFNLSLPTLSTSLKQGTTKETAIAINRAKNFDQDITLKFADLPEGVTLDPASPVIKHGDTEVKITLKAGDEAPVGDFKVTVTGHPTKGDDSSNELKITVTHKDTFTLSMPSTTLKQGEMKAVSISIKRDKDFDQDVALKFGDMPNGVTLDPASPVIKKGEAEAKLTLKSSADASLGDFGVKVTGHPTKGADASNELKLTVAKK